MNRPRRGAQGGCYDESWRDHEHVGSPLWAYLGVYDTFDTQGFRPIRKVKRPLDRNLRGQSFRVDVAGFRFRISEKKDSSYSFRVLYRKTP